MARQRSALQHRATAVRTDIECMAGQPADPIAIALRRWWIRCRGCEQSTAQRQLCGMAVREEADMADAVEPIRHGVQQESPNEFVGSERHHLGLAVVAIVFPGEVDLAIGEPGETRICHGDAMSIAAEIGQHLLRSCERALA